MGGGREGEIVDLVVVGSYSIKSVQNPVNLAFVLGSSTTTSYTVTRDARIK